MIPFTQYVAPRGRKRAMDIERPARIEAVADTIARMGYSFDAEVLSTGEVSLSIENEDHVIAHEITRQLEVPSAVDRLVMNAAKRLKLEVQ